MSEIEIAQIRNRMLGDAAGFLTNRLTYRPEKPVSAKSEIVEYFRRLALRHGYKLKNVVEEPTN